MLLLRPIGTWRLTGDEAAKRGKGLDIKDWTLAKSCRPNFTIAYLNPALYVLLSTIAL